MRRGTTHLRGCHWRAVCPFSVGSAEGGAPVLCVHVCVHAWCVFTCVCVYACTGPGAGSVCDSGTCQKTCHVLLETGKVPGLPASREHCETCRGVRDRTVWPALGPTVGPVEGALHACCFITSPPQPWRAGLPSAPGIPTGALKHRGWAWPPAGGELRFELGSQPLRGHTGGIQPRALRGRDHSWVEVQLALCSRLLPL